MSNIFARKSMAVLKAEAEETEAQALVTHGGVPLKRTLSAWSLNLSRYRLHHRRGHLRAHRPCRCHQCRSRNRTFLRA